MYSNKSSVQVWPKPLGVRERERERRFISIINQGIKIFHLILRHYCFVILSVCSLCSVEIMHLTSLSHRRLLKEGN